MTVDYRLALPEKKKRGRQSKEAIAKHDKELKAWCAGILELRKELDFAPSTRGWCYMLEEHGLTKGEFEEAETLISRSRKRGHLPIDICSEDERRAADNLEYLDDPDPKVHAAELIDYMQSRAAEYIPVSFWQDQKYYVEMAVEKVDLKLLFNSVCEEFHIALTNNAGWHDINGRAAMMRRFRDWERKGKQCVLLYCGDHDPAGLRISNSIRESFDQMRNAQGIRWAPDNLIVDRFGLNADLIERKGLTWIENLETSAGKDLADPSHKDHKMAYVQDYLRQFGVRKCEANALVRIPNEARAMCRKAILKYLRKDAPAKYTSTLQLPRTRLRTALRQQMKRA